MTDSANKNLLAPIYAKHFAEMPGVEVGSLFYVDEFEKLYGGVNKLLYKISPSFVLQGINKRIIASIDEFKPDILLIFKGMEIFPSTLLHAKKHGAKLVNYNPDHPYKFESKGSGNKNVSEALNIYDLHITYSKEIVDSLKKEKNIRAAHLPFGFEIPGKIFDECLRAPEINRACFVGTPDDARKEVVMTLVEAGVPVDVYGTGWHNVLKETDNLKIYGPAIGKDYWKALRQYRVQINVLRKQNFNSHNMRTFEVPAIGGIMLTPYTDEQNDFFAEGKEVFFYRNNEELVKKTKHILSMSMQQAEEVRKAA